jgi:Ca2+-binding EF-hand superfamily protein
MEDKLDLAFQFYDINGDGKISYDKMLAIVEAIYKMVTYVFIFCSESRQGHVTCIPDPRLVLAACMQLT